MKLCALSPSAPTQVVIPNAAYQSAVIANLNATGQAAQVPFYNQLFALYNNAPGASSSHAIQRNHLCERLRGQPQGEPGRAARHRPSG